MIRNALTNLLRATFFVALLGLFLVAQPLAAEAQDAPEAPAPEAEPASPDASGSAQQGTLGLTSALAPDIALSQEDGWVQFDWDDQGVPTTASPTFQFQGCAVIDVTDVQLPGDVFEIYDNGELLDETSEPNGDDAETTDPDEAFGDPAFSFGSFLVGDGNHDISIEVIEAIDDFGVSGFGFIRLRPCPTDVTVEIGALKGDGSLLESDGESDEDATAAQPPNTVYAGEELVYRVKVTNLGKATAERVRVRVTLPGQLRLLAHTLGDDACERLNPGEFPSLWRCALGDIDPLGMVSFEIKTRVRSNAVATQEDGTITIVAGAEVRMRNDDTDESNDEDDDTCFVQDLADLMVMKIAESPTVGAGEPFTYRIIVANNGPSHARGVRIKDDLIGSLGIDIRDADFLDDPNRFDECFVDEPSDEVRCILYGSLEPTGSSDGFPPGQIGSGRWELTVQGRANGPQTLTNKVEVFTGPLDQGPIAWQSEPMILAPESVLQADQGTPDPDLSNNVAQSVIQVQDTIDLDMDLDDDVDPVIAGETVEYEVNVESENTGRVGENVGVRMSLPRGLKVVDIDGLVGNPECEIVENFQGTLLTCYLEDVEPGDGNGETFFVEAFVDPSYRTQAFGAGTDGVLAVSACAFSETQIEIDPRDTCELEFTDVETEVDLDIDKFESIGQDSVVAGEAVEYAITLTNDGPSTIENVVVRDNFGILDFIDDAPVELLEWDVEGGEGSCYQELLQVDLAATSQVRCDLGDIPPTDGRSPQRTIHLRYRVLPDAAQSFLVFPIGLTNCVSGDSDTNNVDAPDIEETCVELDIELESDVDITKSVSPDSATTGGVIKYTLDVVNNGPSTAFDVRVEDNMPVDLEYLYNSNPVCGIDDPPGPATERIRCDLDELGPGETFSVDYYMQVPADYPCFDPIVANIAVVEWNENNFGGRESDQDANVVRTPVRCEIDLKMDKFGKPDGSVLAGEELVYYLRVRNNGPSIVPEGEARITDWLASSGEFTIESIESPFDMECEPDDLPETFEGAVVIECSLEEELEVNDEWPIIVTVTAEEAQDINNRVQAFSENGWDPNQDNNMAMVEHSIEAVADLDVDKRELGVEPFTAGTIFNYELDVNNNGPSTASNVVLVDTLPPGLSVEDINGLGGSPDCQIEESFGNTVVTCLLGDIEEGDTVTVEIEVLIDPNVPNDTTLINSACTYSDNIDDNNGNDCEIEGAEIDALSVLALEKDGPQSPVTAGEIIDYRIDVTNEGPSTARGVVIRDGLDVGGEFLTFLSGNVVPGGGACHYENYGLPDVRCDIGDLQPGESRRIDLRYRVAPDTPPGTLLQNEAGANAQSPIENNEPTWEVFVEPDSEIDVMKRALTPIGVAGGDVSYEIKVTNNGPSTAYDVRVRDFLPEGAEVIWTSDDRCDFNGAGDELRCDIGDLQPGEMYTVQITLRVDPDFACGTDLVNEVRVEWDRNGDGDEDESDGREARTEDVFASIRIDCHADLRVRKYGKPDGQVRAGELLTYTIVVDNLGPSFADGVAIKDVLRSSGAFNVLDVTADRPMNCFTFEESDTYLIDCILEERLSPLGVPGFPNPGRWIIEMVVEALEPQDINNTVSVLSDAFDPDESNNEAFVEHEYTAVSDLDIDKSDLGGEPYIAGTSFDYELTVTNNGPSTAENVVVRDTIPAGLSVIGISGLPGAEDCEVAESFGNTVVTCLIGTLAVGESETFEIEVLIDPAIPDGTTLINSACTYSDNFDDDNSDNCEEETSGIGSFADLDISKIGTPVIVTPGERMTWSIFIDNDGPSVAKRVQIRDVLPADSIFEGATLLDGDGSLVASADCGLALGTVDTVVCDAGDLAVDDELRLLITVLVDPAAAGGPMTNVATTFAANAFPTADTATVFKAPEADLWIDKKILDPTPVAGTNTQYRITVRNDGPSWARNVRVLDALPPGFTIINDDDSCGPVPNAGGFVCLLGDMAPGQTIEILLTVAIDADLLGSADIGARYFNAARVESDTPDPDESNNGAISGAWVETEADLRVRKFGKMDGQVRAGENLTYTLIVDNLGPSFAHDMEVRDEIVSSGLFDIVSIDPDVNGAFEEPLCTVERFDGLPDGPAPQPSNDQRATVVCTTGEDVPVFDGESGEGRWVIEIVVSADQTTDINNVASVSSDDTRDPDPSNNEAYVEHEITDVADLSVTKTCTPAVAGDPQSQSTCTIVVRNDGPSDAENVILADRLPPFTTVTDVRVLGGDEGGAGQCSTGAPGASDDRLVCGLGLLDGEGDRLIRPGEQVTVEIDLLVDSGYLGLIPETETLENDVLVYSDIFDPNQSNNQDYALIPIDSQAVLNLRKADQPDPVVAGELLTYRLTLTNEGPSVASQVELNDRLPDEVEFVSATILDGAGGLVGGADCALQEGNNRVFCRLGDMLVNATYRIFIVTRVDPSTPAGDIRNTAEATADNSEGDDAAETTTVEVLADLSVVKTIDDPSPVAGTQTTYRLTVRNDGPSDAVNVEVTDVLPAGFTLINQDDQCTPVPGEGLISCRPAGEAADWRLGPGEEVEFQLNVAIDPSLTPSAISGLLSVNEAQVGSDTPDPDLRNNTDTADAWIDSVADLRVRKFGKMDGQVRAGELLTYTIITDNLGPSFGHSVTITDEIVSSGVFDIVSIDPDVNGDYAGASCEITRGDTGDAGLAPAVTGIDQRATVTCELGEDLPVFDPGAGAGRWVVEIVVTAPQTTDVNNVASVSSLDLDPDFSNNEAYVEHEITDVADLEISKTAIGQVVFEGCPPIIGDVEDEVTAGLMITYEIEVRNNGPSDAENVLIYDRLPPGIVVTSAEVTTGQGQCSTGMPGSAEDRLICGVHRNQDGDRDVLQPGQRAVVTVTALVNPDLANESSLENDAYVTSDIFDPTLSNNQTYQLTDVSTAADLEIVKTSDPEDTVSAGESLQYTLVVTNLGPSWARDVEVFDLLPAEVTYVSATGAACLQDAIQTREITCELGDMAPGEVREIKILTLVNPDAVPPGDEDVVLLNTASVSSLTFDPCLDNNEDTDETTAVREADVYARKSDSPDPVLAGNELRYLISFGNDGPSTATGVTVRDLLPLGLTFDRCMPIDPNDEVTCTVLGGDGDVTQQEIGLVSIELANAIVWGDPTLDGGLPADASDLDPGETYSFYLVADVDSGYVLDDRGDTDEGEACQAFAEATGYDQYAHNRVTILSQSDGDITAEVGLDNYDDECTRVEGEADLEIDLTDIFDVPTLSLAGQSEDAAAIEADIDAANGGDGVEVSVMPEQAPPPNNAFLRCDPVEPGGMITYVVKVTNNGPSDAAEVVVDLQLDGEFVAVDPAQVQVEFVDANGQPVDGGIVEEIRDDGRVRVVLGRDNNQLGRINAGNMYFFRVMVMVRLDAPCGKDAPAVARVYTRAAQAGNVPGPTPTRDPNLANNIDREMTRIECPAIEVEKTVSYDGTCPGSTVRVIPPTAGKITFCYTIKNTGTTYLDYIRITDTLRTRTSPMPTLIFTDVIRYDKDPKIPVPPGAVLTVSAEIDSLYKECGVATNEVIVTADPVNSGRTRYPCIEPVMASDTLDLEVPCAGVDWRLQLPILNNVEGTCEPWIQVQNVGNAPTKALLLFWGDAGFCPPQAAGPLKAECSGLLRPGSAWSFAAGQVPQGAYSAVAYSMSVEPIEISPGTTRPFADELCNEVFFAVVGDYNEYDRFDAAYQQRGTWEGFDFGKYSGEPLAISVNRGCPDVVDNNLMDHAAYTGISSDMGGAYDPKYGGYTFYAPLVMSSKGDLNSTLHIQNAGNECTSLEIWFKAQDNCLRPQLGDVLALAPGETVSYDPTGAVGPDWLGSAWIRGSQPLGIIVDTMGANHFTSYAGLPADVYEVSFSYGNQVNYAPLIYSEYQGWDTALQVQNLSAVTAAKVKVYFLDRGGDIITTLVDWICPRGSQSFYLPVIENIPGNWVGSARAESQEWWAPGSPLVDPPKISTVVLLEKWTDAARTARREAVAYNAQTECLLFDWQIAPGTKGGTTSGSAVFAIPLIAKGYNGITSEIGITNLVPKPGFTDFAIYLYDQNGLLDFFCQKLNEKQVEYIDLNTWGIVPQRFLGSMVVSAVFWEHDVFDGNGEFERNLVGLGGVAVERIGGTLGGPDVPGDESKAFEALPVFDHFLIEEPPQCPGVGAP